MGILDSALNGWYAATLHAEVARRRGKRPEDLSDVEKSILNTLVPLGRQAGFSAEQAAELYLEREK